MPKLTIDGQETIAKNGTTVLEAARALDIKIPALCYHPALEPYGACRVCLVEVTKGGRTRLTASCTYPVDDGLEVVTQSERITRARKIVIGLMLARAPRSEKIVELAEEYGVTADATDKTAAYLYDRVKGGDPADCILCGLCVRACREVVGRSATSFVHRGGEKAVSTPFGGISDTCIGCGACAYLCPTQAIQVEQAS
ncbi:MAG: 2Fe-2S iron-sulfur cluster-binding protein [Planctomycetota bacterium]|jgi:NADH dehydrogenase/NADH:ubiquinone oxidoreductase subunit G